MGLQDAKYENEGTFHISLVAQKPSPEEPKGFFLFCYIKTILLLLVFFIFRAPQPKNALDTNISH